jgi:hypothetical protein
MAHYAFIDTNNLVTEVIVGKDENDFAEGVNSWEEYYGALRGQRCLQTSYNTLAGVHYDAKTGKPSKDQSKALRKNYAGIGYTYDLEHDAFISPKPYESWVLDEASCSWVAPIEYPSDGGSYVWEESQGDWVEVVNETT